MERNGTLHIGIFDENLKLVSGKTVDLSGHEHTK
jgi:hypothetical protein